MIEPLHMEAAVHVSGPTIKRGESSGDIWTPWRFANAVVEKFGPLSWDLAATKESCKSGTGHFISPGQDSLTVSWHELDCSLCVNRLFWLNPPYDKLTPWVKKCAAESRLGIEILLLVPMGGQNWYWDYVEPYADVYSVGRMVFDNCFDKHGNLVTTNYPKDLILAHYYQNCTGSRPQRWRWHNV